MDLLTVAALLRGEPKPPDPTSDEQKHIVLHHYELVCSRFGVERGTLLMRKFVAHMLREFQEHETFRSCLTSHHSAGIPDVVRRYFPKRDTD